MSELTQNRNVLRHSAITFAYGIALLAGVGYFAAVPAMTGALSFYFYLLMWIALASGLNVMAGFTGYVAFGYVAFFGLGAYTTAILAGKLGFPILFALFGTLLVGIVSSLCFSRILSLRGIYFSMISLAIAVICRALISIVPSDIAGGAHGLSLVAALNPVLAYYSMLALALFAIGISFWIRLSRFGTHLAAIRDDMEAAQVVGLDIKQLRLYAWMISATLGALAGGIEAWYSSVIDLESAFNLLISTKAIIFAAFGGFGTVIGPVFGAIVMYSVDNYIWERFPSLNNLVLGITIVALMVFFPRGAIGSITQRWKSLRKWLL